MGRILSALLVVCACGSAQAQIDGTTPPPTQMPELPNQGKIDAPQSNDRPTSPGGLSSNAGAFAYLPLIPTSRVAAREWYILDRYSSEIYYCKIVDPDKTRDVTGCASISAMHGIYQGSLPVPQRKDRPAFEIYPLYRAGARDERRPESNEEYLETVRGFVIFDSSLGRTHHCIDSAEKPEKMPRPVCYALDGPKKF